MSVKFPLCKSYGIPASDTRKWVRSGELFGKIDLGAELSEDTAAGKLILTRSTSVYLKLIMRIANSDPERRKKKDQKVKLNKKKVWECFIEDYQKRSLYIRLSGKMVELNKLTDEMRLEAELQFKLSRISTVGMYKVRECCHSLENNN